MTVADLMGELARYPQAAPVRIYLKPSMFPDDVGLDGLLDGLPGEYRIGKIERASTLNGYGVYIGVEA